MQDSADTARVFGGGAVFLTGDAQGARATVSDAGCIEHAHRSIVFGASFLRIERGPSPTTQRAIDLQEKVSSCQASDARSTCPLRGTEAWSCRRWVRRGQRFSSRGGKTR
jgi:hypothetical protein